MARVLYRYTFGPEVPVEEAEASLLLAILAAEGLHGEAEVRLDGAHYFDPGGRRCVIAADTRVGMDLNKLFVGFLRREFGEDAFQVERVDSAAGAGERRPADVPA
ncbi:MAG TPA: hypothetical protein VIL46_18950 [Gemmataceae bacterium]